MFFLRPIWPAPTVCIYMYIVKIIQHFILHCIMHKSVPGASVRPCGADRSTPGSSDSQGCTAW